MGEAYSLDTPRPVKRIDIAEFRREGYLQELNRRFLHPLGLALEVVVEPCPCRDGTIEEGPPGATHTVTCPTCHGDKQRERMGGVWDYRDDPEGIYYDGQLDPEKAGHIDALTKERFAPRKKALGFAIEPIP